MEGKGKGKGKGKGNCKRGGAADAEKPGERRMRG